MKRPIKFLILAALLLAGLNAQAAIGYDNSQRTGFSATPTTWTTSYTTSGSNRAIVVMVYNGANTTDGVSGITYGGVAMTKQGFSSSSGITGVSCWTLLNPPSGANNITASISGFQDGSILVASYTGVDQTLGVNASNLNGHPATTVITNSITTTVGGVWGVSLIVNAAGTASASTNINSARLNTNNYSIGDSNGSLGAAGTYSLSWTQGGANENLGSCGIGLREAAAPSWFNFGFWFLF